MKSKISSVIKTIVFALIGVFILYRVYLSQEKSYLADCALKGIPSEDCNLIDKLINDVSHTNLWLIGLSIVFFMFSNIIRAWRWQALLKPIGCKVKTYNAFFAIMIGYIANLAIPRIGEFIRAGSLSKYEKIPTSKVMGTVVTDRIIDALSLLLMIGIAIVLERKMIVDYFTIHSSFSDKINLALNSSIFYIVLIVIAIIFGFVMKNRKKLINKYGFFKKVYDIVSGLMDGVLTIFKLENPLLFILQSITIWVLWFLMSYICMLAFIPTAHLGPIAGLVVFIFGGLGMVFPSPGGMGSYHFLVGEALGFYGVSGADGFSFANIVFLAISILTIIFFGVLSLYLMPLLNKSEKNN